MIGWNPSYNWTHEQFLNAIKDLENGHSSVCLDTEHADEPNEKQIVAWAEELGYKAEVLDWGESIKVSRKENDA